jgi:hypothetical protein
MACNKDIFTFYLLTYINFIIYLTSLAFRPIYYRMKSRGRRLAPSPTNPASYPMNNAGYFPRAKVAGALKLTTRLHLVPTLRMAVLDLHSPHMSSWGVA